MITIAIVEDDKKSAKILQEYILRYSKEKQEPLAVECFENGLNFISDYKASCDIVLMDIEMPHMNGLDTARKLREFDSQKNKNFPVRIFYAPPPCSTMVKIPFGKMMYLYLRIFL